MAMKIIGNSLYTKYDLIYMLQVNEFEAVGQENIIALELLMKGLSQLRQRGVNGRLSTHEDNLPYL